MDRAKKVIENTKELCEKLNRSQKLYFFGLLSAIYSLILYIIPVNGGGIAGVSLTLILLYSAIMSDILIVYQKVWNTTIGKGFLLLTFSLCVHMSYGLSSQLINEAVKFDTSKVVYSITFTAALLLPLLFILLTYLLFAVVFLFGQFYLVIASFASSFKDDPCLGGLIPKNLENYPYTTFFVRLLIYPAAFGILWGTSGAVSPIYAKNVDTLSKEFVYFFDAKAYSRCKQEDGERVISVTDKEIVIAKRLEGRITFSPKKCELRIAEDPQKNKEVEK